MLKYNNNYIKQIITSYDINIWKSFIESTKKDNIFLIFFPFLNILGKYTIGYHYNLPKISDEQRNKLFYQLKELYEEEIKQYSIKRYQENNSEELKIIIDKLLNLI